MKRILFIYLFLICSSNLYSQIYEIINSQLHKKSTYLPKEFYLEQPTLIPFSMNTWIEFANPELLHTSIYVENNEGKVVKRIFNDTLKQGLYTINWNGTNLDGKNVSSGFYNIIVCSKKNSNIIFSDTTQILTHTQDYSQKISLFQKYIDELKMYSYSHSYYGNGIVLIDSLKENKEVFNIKFTKIRQDTTSVSTIRLEGYIYSGNDGSNRLSHVDVVSTDVDLKNFKNGKLPISVGVVSDYDGRFSIFRTNFPTTKVYFLHRGYIIQYFDIGKISTLYKDNKEMYEKTMKAYYKKYNIKP